MINRNDPCWCGNNEKWKKCHYPHLQPVSLAHEYKKKFNILLKTEKQIDGIRQACKLAKTILHELCIKAKAGVTTKELDQLSQQLHQRAGAIAAALGYGTPPFPSSICTSLNNVVCHGIPNDKPLIEGDIVNIDVASILNGYFGDCSAMVAIGSINKEKKLVLKVSYESLNRAIKILKPGVLVSAIGKTIEDYATSQGCSVVNQFVGHGTGLNFHEEPEIPHHYNSIDIPLAPGMVFTIEPMINAGVRELFIDSKNQWTAYTLDGKPSAQWEHTILITQNGHEILTQ
jgi:methionyl aminopeptidase